MLWFPFRRCDNDDEAMVFGASGFDAAEYNCPHQTEGAVNSSSHNLQTTQE